MKKHSIKKQLKQDLSVASRSDFSTLLEKCNEGEGLTCEVAYATGGTTTMRGSRLRLICITLAILLAILATVIYLTGREDSSNNKMGGYFVIDINPSVKVGYDKDGFVTELIPLNEDANVLIYNIDIIGKSSNEAVEILFDRCISLGYFSAERDNNAVLASATSENGELDEKMTKHIKELFTSKFSDKKMLGVVITGIQDSKLDEKASEHGIDSQKYALILHYLELGGELDAELYDDIKISELYGKISELEKQLKQDALEKAREEKCSAEKKLFSSIADSVARLIDELERCITRLDTPATPSSPPGKPNGGGKPHDPSEPRPSIPERDRYEGFVSSFDKYIIELDKAKEASDVYSAVDGILEILNKIKADESDSELIALIDKTIAEIDELTDELEIKSSELDNLDTTIEETIEQRLEAFKDASAGKSENVQSWQKDKEKELMASWYEQKREWENERKGDLMPPKS